MLAAVSSYFFSPTPSGAAAVNTFPQQIAPQLLQLIHGRGDGRLPFDPHQHARSRCTIDFAAADASGHGSPAFNDACGTWTLRGPAICRRAIAPVPGSRSLRLCFEALSGPVLLLARVDACLLQHLSVFSVLAGHNNSRNDARVASFFSSSSVT